jgi:anthranilate synthase component 2
MRLLIFDNYDSFTYNLVQLIRDMGVKDFNVIRNDKIPVHEAAVFDKILISPGPGIPEEAGILKELIRVYAPAKSIMGVCLGQQAIAEVFGGTLINLKKVYHGVVTDIHVVAEDYLFKSVPDSFTATRYHSWVVDKDSLSEDLEVTAIDNNGMIMALRHRYFDVRGVQFHPESFLSQFGKQIISNFINYKPEPVVISDIKPEIK